jgi:hypothetical protein
VISIVGYAKSGKTTFICALLRAAVKTGLQVAVIKTGRAGHAEEGGHAEERGHGERHGHGDAGPGADSDIGPHRPAATPDSERFLQAGAATSVFWSERGILNGLNLYPPPLPGRSEFHDRWYELLPPAVARELQRCDLLIIEGRLARGAETVHLVGPTGWKYPVQTDDLVVKSPEDTAAAITRLVPQGGNDVR